MTSNKSVLNWIEEMKNLVNPDHVVFIDGTEEQREQLRAQAMQTGELIKLNQEKLPGCYLHRTAVNDVARVEDRTFICSRKQETPVQLITGRIPKKLIRCCTILPEAVMWGGRCMSFPIPWAR